MEVIKRKILLENYVDRTYDSPTYGELIVDNFYMTIPLYQDMKDIGIFTFESFVPQDSDLILTPSFYQPLYSVISATTIYTFNFIENPTANFVATGDDPSVRYAQRTLDDYIGGGIKVSGLTSDRLGVVESYGFTGPDRFRVGFDVIKENYVNYLGDFINGRTRVLANSNLNPIDYVLDANIQEAASGTTELSDGIFFRTLTGTTRVVEDAISGAKEIPTTEIYYKGQSFNETNVGLSALTKREYLLHITQPPKVDSDIFIDRGTTTVLQSHLQLAEINSLEHLLDYGNGFYNFIR